jgi:D-alanyl-lipoteichoic acid acyltransferase DltB (MBOAT superfamily)
LLLLVTGLNYAAVQKLTALNDRRKRTLVFSLAVVFDVGLLAFYKLAAIYLPLGSIQGTLGGLLPVTKASLLAFPLGLSFFIFQMISCVTDVYRRKYQWNSGAGSFFLFAFFFPQISAGPIPRAGALVPQLTSPRRPTAENLEAGIALFTYGLFKKLVVANRLQTYVDHVFVINLRTSAIPVLVASVFNALRLYADFSGYTDMARGSARLFGIDLAENFNYPLLAESVTEFWQRWHMTLSSWLRDYLYKPLVFRIRRVGDSTAVVVAIVFTFLICGLWHRCSWPFAVFGLMNGVVLSLEFLTRRPRSLWLKRWPWLGTPWFGRAYVFSFFVLTGVMFRVSTLSRAWQLYGKILVPRWPATAPELFGHIGPMLFLINFTALALWGGVAAVRPKWAEQHCARFVLLCAVIMLTLGHLSEGDFIYVAF